MKILHLIQKRQLRGAEIFTSQLASHTNNSSNSAIIISLFAGDADLPFDGEIISLNGKPGWRFWDIQAWSKLARLVKAEKPDIIQANAGDTLKYAVFSKLLFGWKQPIFFRNASTISLYVRSGIAKKFNSFFFRFAAKIISVSKASADDFATLFPEHKKKIITIPIGIEHIGFDQPRKPGRVEKVHDVDRPWPLLIHVGGFSFEKNHRGLIEIFEIVLEQYQGARLHLVGDGLLRKQVEDIVSQKGLEASVKFYGFRKNVLEHISGADVLLLPSIIEGLPGVILEAFYCRTAVVAYDVGGIGEVLINNRTGRLINKGNQTAFAQGVSAALVDDRDNDELINNAYHLVTTEYLNTQVAQQFMDVYESAYGNHPILLRKISPP